MNTDIYHDAEELLEDAGYEITAEVRAYAEKVGYADENQRGAAMLARLLYSDEQLEETPYAGWNPVHFSEAA